MEKVIFTERTGNKPIYLIDTKMCNRKEMLQQNRVEIDSIKMIILRRNSLRIYGKRLEQVDEKMRERSRQLRRELRNARWRRLRLYLGGKTVTV